MCIPHVFFPFEIMLPVSPPIHIWVGPESAFHTRTTQRLLLLRLCLPTPRMIPRAIKSTPQLRGLRHSTTAGAVGGLHTQPLVRRNVEAAVIALTDPARLAVTVVASR